MSQILKSIKLGGTTYEGPITFEFEKYASNGGLAIQMFTSSDGYPELLATVTTNLEGIADPSEGCVFVKNYSENEGVLEALIEAGLLEKTGRSVMTGWVTIQEARLIGGFALRLIGQKISEED